MNARMAVTCVDTVKYAKTRLVGTDVFVREGTAHKERADLA